MEEPEIIYESKFIPEETIDKSISLLENLPFVSSRHLLYGKVLSSSVKYVWVSDTGLEYNFSKAMVEPLKCYSFEDFPVLKCFRDYLQDFIFLKYGISQTFNSVLVNRYEDGSTGLSYHDDNDVWLGKDFIVPSISLGAKRRFYVKSKDKTNKHVYKYELESGSLAIMMESVQKYWLHSIPKQLISLDDPTKKTGVRYNLTFRNIYPSLFDKMPKPKKIL